MPETQRALTDEAWRKQIAGTAAIKRMGEAEVGLGVYAILSSDPRIPEQNDTLNPAYGCRPPYLVLHWETVEASMALHRPHRLAALCLYGQRFGFRQRQVELLRAFATFSGIAPELREEASELASLIAALLPPVSDQTQ